MKEKNQFFIRSLDLFSPDDNKGSQEDRAYRYTKLYVRWSKEGLYDASVYAIKLARQNLNTNAWYFIRHITLLLGAGLWSIKRA